MTQMECAGLELVLALLFHPCDLPTGCNNSFLGSHPWHTLLSSFFVSQWAVFLQTTCPIHTSYPREDSFQVASSHRDATFTSIGPKVPPCYLVFVDESFCLALTCNCSVPKKPHRFMLTISCLAN